MWKNLKTYGFIANGFFNHLYRKNCCIELENKE